MSDLADDGAIEPNHDRIRWLKSLAKGAGYEGITDDDVPPPSASFEYGDHTARNLKLAIFGAGLAMPRWRATRAVFNALGIEHLWGGPDFYDNKIDFPSAEYEAEYRRSLMARRRYLADALKVSLRTVMRLEDVGFILLDDYLSRVEPDRYEAQIVLRIMSLARASPEDALKWVRRAERELLEKYPQLSASPSN